VPALGHCAAGPRVVCFTGERRDFWLAIEARDAATPFSKGRKFANAPGRKHEESAFYVLLIGRPPWPPRPKFQQRVAVGALNGASCRGGDL
jgi:hypothetical protein